MNETPFGRRYSVPEYRQTPLPIPEDICRSLPASVQLLVPRLNLLLEGRKSTDVGTVCRADKREGLRTGVYYFLILDHKVR